jgi:C-terminal processing protease CtpA/Prc
MVRGTVRLSPPILAGAIAILLLSAPRASHAEALLDTLSFEFPDPSGGFAGWWMRPPGTVFSDSHVVHGGRYAARLTRGPKSPGDFSTVGRSAPVTFQGDTIEVRGWLRTDGVENFAGLWLREDGAGGTIELDNMQERSLSGTTPWTEYRIALALDRNARRVFYGALVAGTGTVWADDLRLLVDGKPVSEAPPLVRESTAMDTDHEFDAGSGIEAADLSPAQVQNLVLLARVWGFLKYHHPKVTSAALQWDYELFRVLPEVLAAKSRTEASAALTRWLDRIGAPPACDPCATEPDSVYMLPRLGWIRDSKALGADLSARLARIYTNRDADGDQYFIQFVGIVPTFTNEVPYGTPSLPDAGYRLLALFRLWNIAEYWFPYRDLIADDWDRVLGEFIPRVVAARDLESYRLEMLALTARLRDGHASVWNAIDARPPRGGCQLPVALRSVEGRYVVSAIADTALASASGLKVGDVILSLDGEPVEASAKKSAPYVGSSNDVARRREIARFLTRGPCGACRVAIERAGAKMTLDARRDSSSAMDLGSGMKSDLPGPTFRLLDRDVAYLKLSSFRQSEVDTYLTQAAGTKCLVVDIRNYPSEFAPFSLGGRLVDRPTPFSRFTRGDASNPGAFLWTEPVIIQPEPPRYSGKIVILVDEWSQSQSEYTAMALRAVPGAIVVGSTTAGADGNLVLIPLPGGLRAAMTGIGAFYPNKRPTQQIGIIPDLVVEPTIDGIRTGRDVVLEAGLKKVLGRNIPIKRW